MPRRSFLRTVIRIVIPVIIVMTISVLAFRSGVNVSDRADIPDSDLITQLYYSMGLFTLGGMDLGMPTGGPPFWQGALVLMYFLAPALAAFTVIEGLWRLIWQRMVFNWPWRNHIVVAGGGRVARAVVDRCREVFPGVSILVVEKNLTDSQEAHFSALKRVHLIGADMAERDTHAALRVEQAKCLFLITNDELVNVETAVQYKDDFKARDSLPMLVRVADLDLMERANAILGSETWEPCVNIHRSVAQKICRDSIDYMRQTAGKETLVFTGFGRFSQTYLRQFIALRGVEQIESMVIIDLDAELCWQRFLYSLSEEQREQLDRIPVLRKTGRQEDPRMWHPLLDEHGRNGESDGKLVILLGTNEDQANFKTAMRVRDQKPDAYVMFRMFGASRFSRQVASEMNLNLVDIEKELNEQIRFWVDGLK
ncbi:MAG: NAD-binding protein [Myxococcota bacterium]|nr:NAD-binding protein [Myxococcota bacterium]